MASANPAPGPRAAPQSVGSIAATPEQLQTAFDAGIWYHLSLWPALSVAVANDWGGPTSSDKRDWFAGAVSDLFAKRPDTDALDLETVMLQVMQDEFDVNVEDESEVPVAADIMRLSKQIAEGDLGGVEQVRMRWEKRGGKVGKVNVVEHKHDEDEDDEEEEDEEDGGVDVEMGDAPAQLVPVKERPEPEVDEDGFTTVVSKKRR